MASPGNLGTNLAEQALDNLVNQFARPLDFLVVADHSDNMGFFPDLFAGAPHLLSDATGKRWYDMVQSGSGGSAALEIIDNFGCLIGRLYRLVSAGQVDTHGLGLQREL